MTPDHQQLIESILQAAYARTGMLMNGMSIPLGKNPPQYTREMLWRCPLAQDLVTIAEYVEGHPFEDDIRRTLTHACLLLFGNTLDQQTFRLPHKFHKTPLGGLFYAAFARYYPLDAFMRTHEVVKLFGVSRQTIYDWSEEGKLAPYYVHGTQMFLRKQVEQEYNRRQRKKLQRKGIVTQL